MTTRRPNAGVRWLVCAGCEDRFEAPVRTGPPPQRCPDCRQIRKEERERERREDQRARKLAASPETVSCRICGKTVGGYRRGRRGGVPQFCRECSEQRRMERNRASAAKSYRRRKAARRDPRSSGTLRALRLIS